MEISEYDLRARQDGRFGAQLAGLGDPDTTSDVKLRSVPSASLEAHRGPGLSMGPPGPHGRQRAWTR